MGAGRFKEVVGPSATFRVSGPRGFFFEFDEQFKTNNVSVTFNPISTRPNIFLEHTLQKHTQISQVRLAFDQNLNTKV